MNLWMPREPSRMPQRPAATRLLLPLPRPRGAASCHGGILFHAAFRAHHGLAADQGAALPTELLAALVHVGLIDPALGADRRLGPDDGAALVAILLMPGLAPVVILIPLAGRRLAGRGLGVVLDHFNVLRVVLR